MRTQSPMTGILLLLFAALVYAGCQKPVAADIPAEARAEVQRLQDVLGVSVTWYEAQAGDHTVPAGSALTADKLTGKPLDENPPQLGERPVYPEIQQDLVEQPTYQVPGLGNFRLKYFNNGMDFGRDHTWPMNDYSSTHGYNYVSLGGRDRKTVTYWPEGTQVCGGFGIGRHGMVKALVGDGERLDLLGALSDEVIIEGLIGGGFFKGFDPAKYDMTYLDLEEGCPPLERVRGLAFYPKEGTAAEKAAFEKRYYDGLAKILYCPVEAARKLGFKNLTIYGWNPDWWESDGDPEKDYYWQNVGKQILPHLDWVCCCNYYTQPTPAFVGARLLDVDSNLRFMETLPPAQRRPLRPFYSNQFIHYVQWCYLAPATKEEMQATTALGAFTQYDGMILWCNAVLQNDKSCNDNLPPPLFKDLKVEFRDTYSATQEGGGTRTFKRYELANIVAVEGEQVRFQYVDPVNWKDHGLGDAYPYYTATAAELTAHLISPFECMQGLYEGLGMVKQVEWTVRHGEIVRDQDSKVVAQQVLPIARHIRAGDLHLVATYDPKVAFGGEPRAVVLRNFAGVEGLNLTFPAGGQTRIFLVGVVRGS